MASLSLIKLFWATYFFVILRVGGDSDVCDNNECILKCCSEGKYLESDGCLQYNSTNIPDFSDETIYDGNFKKVNKTFKFEFDLDRVDQFDTFISTSFKVYIIEDGSLRVQHTANNIDFNPTIVNGKSFCADYSFTDNQLYLTFLVKSENNEEGEMPTRYVTFNAVALIVSSFFLVLVLIVYILIRELWTIPGKIIMSIVLSLFSYSIMLASQLLLQIMESSPTTEFCLASTFLIYMFSLSSWCWMNVMSFRAWRSFRNFRKPSEKRVAFFDREYLKYSCYGWGLPLAMAVMLITIELSDLNKTPWFIKPNVNLNGCYITGYSQFLYQYVPMLIIILSNWVFFLMTTWNLCQTRRQTVSAVNAGTSTSHHRESFFVCLKLSLITGASYIFEIMNYVAPQYKTIWYITDTYNILAGVLIFFVFVCKKSTIKLLRQKLNKLRQRNGQDSFPITKDTTESYSATYL